jgi:DNA-binding NtrC family response regulator
MPARVVVALDEHGFADKLAGELRAQGYDAAALPDSMVALKALESASRIELLVTSPEHAQGKPSGLALARMARMKRPGIKVVFLGEAWLERYTAGLGEFMPTPLTVPEIVEAVARMLSSDDPV